jgi:hypothetical protein
MATQQTTSSEVDELSEKLAEEGVISVQGYLEQDTCDKIKREVKEKVNNDAYEKANDDMSGSDLMEASRTVLVERGGEWDWDQGMLDIFNIDETIPEAAEIKGDDFISGIINKADQSVKYTPENINVYFNKSVTNTRGYHADSYDGQYKAFVYLTDVPDESYGPYSYIKGSHKKTKVRRKVEGAINRMRGTHPTNAISYNEDNVVKFTAPKGTLIISDQSGYHRGMPQKEGKERMLISNSYTSD